MQTYHSTEQTLDADTFLSILQADYESVFLTNCIIEGSIVFSTEPAAESSAQFVVDKEIICIGCTFKNSVKFEKTDFQKEVFFGNCVFQDAVYFRKTVFQDSCDFGESKFGGTCSLSRDNLLWERVFPANRLPTSCRFQRGAIPRNRHFSKCTISTRCTFQ